MLLQVQKLNEKLNETMKVVNSLKNITNGNHKLYVYSILFR